MFFCVTDDEELERLRKDTVDGGKLKLRKSNMKKEGVGGSPGMGRVEKGHGIIMDDKPDFIQSMPLSKQLVATSSDLPIVNKSTDAFSKSCVAQMEAPPEFALIEKHNIVSVAG